MKDRKLNHLLLPFAVSAFAYQNPYEGLPEITVEKYSSEKHVKKYIFIKKAA